MKEWYFNLDNDKKKLLHGAMIIIWFFIIVFFPDGGNTFLSLLWLTVTLFEIMFIIYHVQYNKNEQAKSNNEAKNFIVNKEEIKIEVNANIYCSDFIDVENEEYLLKYSYKQNLCFCENFDSFQLRNAVSFKLEPDNQYDPNTVAVYVDNKKIGLMYKGDAREIVISCLKRNKYQIEAYVNYRDEENQKSGIVIGFYSKLSDRESFETSIIKTSKRDELTDEKRYERLELMSEGDVVELEESYDVDGLLVIDEGGYELGEISESAAEKVENFGGVDNIVARISEINDEDYDKLKFKIRIYCKK